MRDTVGHCEVVEGVGAMGDGGHASIASTLGTSAGSGPCRDSTDSKAATNTSATFGHRGRRHFVSTLRLGGFARGFSRTESLNPATVMTHPKSADRSQVTLRVSRISETESETFRKSFDSVTVVRVLRRI
jgi:hypothetical protein